jgi:heme oxygenase
MIDLGPLHAATRDLHHAVEQTAFGQAMASGQVSEQAWTDWLQALRVLHMRVDPFAAPVLRRADEVMDDIIEMHGRGFKPRLLLSPQRFVDQANDEQFCLGAVYVLGGAHVMGGALIAKRVAGRLPTAHLVYNDGDRREAVAAVKALRDRNELAAAARACFSVLIDIGNEIEARGL